MVKIPTLIFAVILLVLPNFSQESKRPFGWDLTYLSVLETNKIGSRTFIRKWLASEYQVPAKKWISEWKGEPIISSILIEYPAFHAAEHTTLWLFRTKNNAYYWIDIEDTRFSDEMKKQLKLEEYDKILAQAFSWKQAKPMKQIDPQSLPGYIGFLSLYDKEKSRQLLLTMEDFMICKTKNCKGVKSGRLFHALEPIILEKSISR